MPVSGLPQVRPVRDRPARRLRLAGAAACATLLLAGCGADADPAAAPADPGSTTAPDPDGPRVVQGGEPGQEASELPGDVELPRTQWTHEDEMFMQMMIPHHAQALQMTDLATDRASDERVVRLAERIAAAQGPEIQMMAAWLEERELRVPEAADDPEEFDHSAHGHTEMAGMLSPAELDRLAAASGRDFDRLFLEFMIKHHEGAVQMAEETAAGGLDVIAGETRDGMASHQSSEIGRMARILADL